MAVEVTTFLDDDDSGPATLVLRGPDGKVNVSEDHCCMSCAVKSLIGFCMGYLEESMEIAAKEGKGH